MITLLTLVFVWIPDSNGSRIENGGPFLMNSLQGIKGVMIFIPTVGKGEVVFFGTLFVKLVFPVIRSGEGSDNINEMRIRLHK